MDRTRDPQPEAEPTRAFGPVLSPLLADRRMSIALATAGVAQVTLTLLHVGGMPCPFVRITGRPCPGCGLSRACAALCRGNWAAAVQSHAFAPVVLLAIALFAAAAVLPTRARDRLIRVVARSERPRWIWPTVVTALLLYWVVRLRYPSAEFARLAVPGL